MVNHCDSERESMKWQSAACTVPLQHDCDRVIEAANDSVHSSPLTFMIVTRVTKAAIESVHSSPLTFIIVTESLKQLLTVCTVPL